MPKVLLDSNPGLNLDSCSTRKSTRGGGGGLEPVELTGPSYQLDMASSPSGAMQILVGRWPKDPIGQGVDQWVGYMLRRQGEVFLWPPEAVSPAGLETPTGVFDRLGPASDPDVVFLDEMTVLVAWTQDFSREDPEVDALVEGGASDTDLFNRATSRFDVVCVVGPDRRERQARASVRSGPAVEPRSGRR